MAPLDPEQKAEVNEMIRLGQIASHEAAMAEIAKGNIETVRVSTDMRVTTEEFVKQQLTTNTGVEKKCLDLTREIEEKFTKLRQELDKGFDSTKANAGEIRDMLASFEGQKETMAMNITSHF